MEIIKLIALLIGSALLLVSCSGTPSHTLSYQEKPFRAHISWQSEEACFSALLVSIPESESTPATHSLEFRSPDSLSGILIEKIQETVTVSLDGMEISAPHAARWLEVAKLFSIDATVKESRMTELSGVKLNYIEATNDSGESFLLYLYPDSGLPRRICADLYGAPVTLDVISFEFIPD